MIPARLADCVDERGLSAALNEVRHSPVAECCGLFVLEGGVERAWKRGEGVGFVISGIIDIL